MAAQAGGDSAGIGTRLRAAREHKALTILQAAEKMHVDARILESLEAEDFAALGAPVYARGHLQHYAELLGESAAQLQELYSNATRAAAQQPDLTRIPRGEPEDGSRRLVGPMVIVLVAIALIGIVWWLLSLSNGQVQPTPVQERMENGTAEKPAPATSATLHSKSAADGD
jgi:cytoskeletal protein RodZ